MCLLIIQDELKWFVRSTKSLINDETFVKTEKVSLKVNNNSFKRKVDFNDLEYVSNLGSKLLF